LERITGYLYEYFDVLIFVGVDRAWGAKGKNLPILGISRGFCQS
jgi:hypothetical protein